MKKSQNEWIAITDNSPSKDGRYIVYIPTWNWIGVSSLRNGKFDDISATHYMPLPEKPEAPNK